MNSARLQLDICANSLAVMIFFCKMEWHRSNSNKSGLEEDAKEDSISTISLDLGFYALGSDTNLDYYKNGIWKWII